MCTQRTRTTFKNCCSAVILAIIISAVDVASGTEEPPVILESTLKQNSLCPEDRSATFTCTTTCTRVHWRINGRDLIIFTSNEVGDPPKQADNHHATLLRCSEDSDGVERCISVLNIVDPSPSGGTTRVECYNGTVSTIVGIDYHHRVADPPSALLIFSSQPLGQNLFAISWTWVNHNDSQLSYFEVQLDDTPSVRTQHSSIILSSNATGTNHTLELVAVDMCGQRGSVATQVITTSAVTTTSSSITSTSSSTSPSQRITSTVATVVNKGYNFSGRYDIILIALLVHCVIGALANIIP